MHIRTYLRNIDSGICNEKKKENEHLYFEWERDTVWPF